MTHGSPAGQDERPFAGEHDAGHTARGTEVTDPALTAVAALWGVAPGQMQMILDRAGIGADLLADRIVNVLRGRDAEAGR